MLSNFAVTRYPELPVLRAQRRAGQLGGQERQRRKTKQHEQASADFQGTIVFHGANPFRTWLGMRP